MECDIAECSSVKYAGAFLYQRKLLDVSIDANFLWLKVQCDAPNTPKTVLSFCELFRSFLRVSMPTMLDLNANNVGQSF